MGIEPTRDLIDPTLVLKTRGTTRHQSPPQPETRFYFVIKGPLYTEHRLKYTIIRQDASSYAQGFSLSILQQSGRVNLFSYAVFYVNLTSELLVICATFNLLWKIGLKLTVLGHGIKLPGKKFQKYLILTKNISYRLANDAPAQVVNRRTKIIM